MGNKYRLKKRYTLSLMSIVIAIMVVTVIMTTGYALWGTKLNISGEAIADMDPAYLRLNVELSNVGTGRYTTLTDSENGFLFVSDSYSDNSLVTTIRAQKNIEMIPIIVSFNMKNNSAEGNLYTDGVISKIDISNQGGAISDEECLISKTQISSGNAVRVDFSADVDCEKLVSPTYFKYEISYKENNVKKYFYYTIRLLPKE